MKKLLIDVKMVRTFDGYGKCDWCESYIEAINGDVAFVGSPFKYKNQDKDERTFEPLICKDCIKQLAEYLHLDEKKSK